MEQSLCFDDVLISPRFSNIKSRKDVNLSIDIGINGRHLILKTPLISSPMDTVSMSLMCIKMAMYGGLGILHRYQTIQSQVAELKKVKRYLQYIITTPYTIKPTTTLEEVGFLKKECKVSTFCVIENNSLIGLLTNRDIEYRSITADTTLSINSLMTPKDKLKVIKMTPTDFSNIVNTKNQILLKELISNAKQLMILNKVEKIPIVDPEFHLLGLITYKNVKHFEDNSNLACLDNSGMLACGAAIGIVGDWVERLQQLVDVGVDCICIDVASGHNENLGDAIDAIRKTYPNLVLIAGNVCTADGFKYLAEKDVDAIRCGIGNGSSCITRGQTGIGRGQLSSIMDCFNIKTKYKLPSHIISDGGSMNSTGNKAKAIIAGSSAIMLGRTLAATEESPSIIIYKDGQKFKYTRGMASTSANISKMELCDGGLTNETFKKHSEGVDGYTQLSGTVKDVVDTIVSGVKSSFSYIGCSSITEVHYLTEHKQIEFNMITSLGMNETKTRLIKF
jgi:IMP dehydrogenase